MEMKVGLIGCGNISRAYLQATKLFPTLRMAACADLNNAATDALSSEFGTACRGVEELLADEEIEVVLNLTTPQAHAEVNSMALDSGKHVYCEKPFAISSEDGRSVVDLAARKGLLAGCAPDTFLGGAHQTVRKLIDEGAIGRPVAGTAFMMCRGHESWHPNPGFYYLRGGGPLFDMGPYYLTSLVNLLGPVKRVSAFANRTFEERIATCRERNGERLPVEVPTHVAGTLEFHCGALVTMVMSFDVWKHTNHHMEIHGSDGSIRVPDPNGFGGAVSLFGPNAEDWRDVELTHGYTGNMRGLGLADMALAARTGRKPRCAAELGYHVLEVMQAFHESANEGVHIEIESSCERPAPLPVGLKEGELE